MIAEAEDEKASAFAVSQEDIDSVLTRESGFQDGKYRIYRQFQKYEDSKSNIAFLKKEYGTGGGTHLYPDGTNGGEWHDGKGIGIEKHGSYTNPDLRLSWSKVEKRLRELIKANRYLNPKEKDHYADYLESVSAPQYEVDAQRKMARQRFIDAHRDLPPADKRDTLALRLSDFIRDLDGYEKDLLSNVERSALADVTAEQMEQHLSDPAAVQQLLDFLTQIQWKTKDEFTATRASCDAEIEELQSIIESVDKQREMIEQQQQLLKEIEDAIKEIVSGVEYEDEFYKHILDKMVVQDKDNIDVYLNLLPMKWSYTVAKASKKAVASEWNISEASLPTAILMPMTAESAHKGRRWMPPAAKTVATAAKTAGTLFSQVRERKRRWTKMSKKVSTSSDRDSASREGMANHASNHLWPKI